MNNFKMLFGKYKGQMFLDTPKNYQTWLLSQDWFKVPTKLDEMQQAQKIASQCASKLNGWNGYTRKGAAAYDRMFEAEKAMDNAYYNSSDPCSPRWNGKYEWE